MTTTFASRISTFTSLNTELFSPVHGVCELDIFLQVYFYISSFSGVCINTADAFTLEWNGCIFAFLW